MSDNGNGSGNKLTHRVWVEGQNPGVGFRRVGSVFSHGDGRGFNVVLEARPVGVIALLRDVAEENGPDPKQFSQDRWSPNADHLSHKVFAVVEKGEGREPFWLELGRAYVMPDKKGLVLLMDNAWPDDLKPVLREPKSEPPKGRSSFRKR